jgi:hypothetical protein
VLPDDLLQIIFEGRSNWCGGKTLAGHTTHQPKTIVQSAQGLLPKDRQDIESQQNSVETPPENDFGSPPKVGFRVHAAADHAT